LADELKTLRKPTRGKPHSKRTCELLTTPRFARYLRQTKRGLVKIDMSGVRTEEKLDGKWGDHLPTTTRCRPKIWPSATSN